MPWGEIFQAATVLLDGDDNNMSLNTFLLFCEEFCGEEHEELGTRAYFAALQQARDENEGENVAFDVEVFVRALEYIARELYEQVVTDAFEQRAKLEEAMLHVLGLHLPCDALGRPCGAKLRNTWLQRVWLLVMAGITKRQLTRAHVELDGVSEEVFLGLANLDESRLRRATLTKIFHQLQPGSASPGSSTGKISFEALLRGICRIADILFPHFSPIEGHIIVLQWICMRGPAALGIGTEEAGEGGSAGPFDGAEYDPEETGIYTGLQL